MVTPKSTFIPDAKRTEVYFDANEMIEAYESKFKHKMDEKGKEIIHMFEEFINMAYQDGYNDGMENKK